MAQNQMSRRDRETRNRKSTGQGEVIRVPTQAHSDAADSVLQFFALLAYPHTSERAERDKAAEALHAAMCKARIWDRRNDRSIRMLLPLADRKMKIRTIQQRLNKWNKRINRRLRAGNLAARFYYKGRSIPSAGIVIVGPDSTRGFERFGSSGRKKRNLSRTRRRS